MRLDVYPSQEEQPPPPPPQLPVAGGEATGFGSVGSGLEGDTKTAGSHKGSDSHTALLDSQVPNERLRSNYSMIKHVNC